MRIVNGSSNGDGASLHNKFNSFECPDSATKNTSNLMPSKAALKDMPKSNKRRIIMSDDEDDHKSPTPRKAKPTSKEVGTPSSVEWLDSRKPSNISHQEREKNIQTAVEQRKQQGHPVKIPKVISKVPTVKQANSDSEELEIETPIANAVALRKALSSKGSGGNFKSSLLNETFNEDVEEALEARRLERTQSRSESRANRVDQRAALPTSNTSSATTSKPVFLKDIFAGKSSLDAIDLDNLSDMEEEDRAARALLRQERKQSHTTKPSGSHSSSSRDTEQPAKKARKAREVVIEDSDVEDNDSEAGGYGSDLDQGQIREMANKVLQQCEGLSANLRRSLKQWESGGDSADTSDTTQAGKNSKDCVDLIAIKPAQRNSATTTTSATTSTASSLQQILYDEDIAQLCPELSLKGYQLVGVNWLKLLHQNNVNGVLADDMGLGKTIQTIAFLGWLASLQSSTSSGTRRAPPRAHLIVVPASTLANWQNELQRFCPAFNVVTYYGTQNERAMLRYELRAGLCPDVILSTYTIFERESNKSDRAFLCSMQFEYLVLDEAHCIKNAQSSRFLHLNMLKTKHRLLLSGTPVQNDISELLSMLSFLMPQVFGRENRELLIEAINFDTNHTTTSNSKQTGISLVQLRSMLAPFVLRRLKRDVLDQLSEKSTVVVRLNMTAMQQQVYDNILLSHAAKKDLLKLKHKEEDEVSKILEGTRVRVNILSTLDDHANSTGDFHKPKNIPLVPPIVTTTTSTSNSNIPPAPKDKPMSPFNRRIKRDNKTPEGMHVISLLSPESAPRGTKKTQPGVTLSSAPSIEDLSDLTSTKITSADIDVSSLPLITDTTHVTTTNTIPNNSTATSDSTLPLSTMSASEANHLFTALRKAANHPLLLRVRYTDPEVLTKIAMITYSVGHFGNQCDFQRVQDEINTFSDFDIHQLCLEYDALNSLQLTEDVLYDSPKMHWLKENLPKLKMEGHRVLVFSQWTRLLDLLEVLLQDINLTYLRLDGSTPVKQRQDLIDTFNRDLSIPVFLLSTKAGGLGINLTAADTVVLHDLDFNPENDKQAEDRCHRIGQTKPVTVYKLFAKESVDEDIFEMGERKSKLSKAVLQDDRAVAVAVAGQNGTPADGKKGKGRGKGKDPSGEGQDTTGGDAQDGEASGAAISSILQKALLKRVQKLQQESQQQS